MKEWICPYRCRAIFKQLKMGDFSKVNIEVLGSESNYGPHSAIPQVMYGCWCNTGLVYLSLGENIQNV